MSNRKYVKTTGSEKRKKSPAEITAGIWFILMTAIFPLFFAHRYAYIGLMEAKYGFFLVVSIACSLLIILFNITGKKSFSAYRPSNALDIFVLAFFAVATVGLLFSKYRFQVIFGNEGRYCGWLFWLLITLNYFCISRNMRFKTWYFIPALTGILLTALIGITDYFNMDIFGFQSILGPERRGLFTSTIGNINIYTGIMAVPFGITGAMYALGDAKKKNTLYLVLFFVFSLALIAGRSDNAYLSIGALLVFLPFAAFKKRIGIRRYIGILAAVLTAAALVSYWSRTLEGIVFSPDGILLIIEKSGWIKYAAIGMWIAFAVMYLGEKKLKTAPGTPAPAWIRIAWIALAAVMIVGAGAGLIAVNADPSRLPAFLSPYEDMIIMSDTWGTKRGFVWRVNLENFTRLPFIQKLFGAGLETTGIYMRYWNFEEMCKITDGIFDVPHNEYIQMLFNCGILGLISYVGGLVSAVVLSVKYRNKRYHLYTAAIAFAVICHMGECTVNIQCPPDWGYFLSFVTVAGAIYYTYKKEEKTK